RARAAFGRGSARDHVEDDLRRRGDRVHERPERLQPPPQAEIDHQRAARQPAIGTPEAEPDRGSRDQRRKRTLHVLATTVLALPGWETQKRLQRWVAGRLKRTRQPPRRSTMNRPTCIDDAPSPAQRTNTCRRFGGSPCATRESETLRGSACS